MTCDDLLKAMNEYVDGVLDLGVCKEFADHLAGCNPCQVVVDNIRRTIALYRDGEPYPIPVEIQERLQNALLARWKTLFPNNTPE